MKKKQKSLRSVKVKRRKPKAKKKPVEARARMIARTIRLSRDREFARDVAGWHPSFPASLDDETWFIFSNRMRESAAACLIDYPDLLEVSRALKKEFLQRSPERQRIIDTIRELRDEGGGKPPFCREVSAKILRSTEVTKRSKNLDRYIRTVAKEEWLLLATNRDYDTVMKKLRLDRSEWLCAQEHHLFDYADILNDIRETPNSFY